MVVEEENIENYRLGPLKEVGGKERKVGLEQEMVSWMVLEDYGRNHTWKRQVVKLAELVKYQRRGDDTMAICKGNISSYIMRKFG